LSIGGTGAAALMDLVELLTVASHFQLQRRGLVIAPDFAAPNTWKARSEEVVIRRPDGHERGALARIEVWHFEIRDPTISANHRWRLVVSLPALTKEDVPVGSKVMVTQILRAEMEAGHA
jgi:hypothetical protein